jgi:hypothetical protein
MQHHFGGPDPTSAALRILSGVVERPENDQARYIVGVVLTIATIPDGLGPQEVSRPPLPLPGLCQELRSRRCILAHFRAG